MVLHNIKVIKLYSIVSEKEYNVNPIFPKEQVLIVDGKEFKPYIYEKLDSKLYRFDGYHIEIDGYYAEIDGYESFCGYHQLNQIGGYYRKYKELVNSVETSFRQYCSSNQIKCWEKYKRLSKIAEFYRKLLEAINSAE